MGSTLLLIEKATHDPLYLWDINAPPVPFGKGDDGVVRSLRVLLLERTPLISHKYRGSCVAFSISKSVEPNEELKVG